MTEIQKRINELGDHLDATAARIRWECEAMRGRLDVLRHEAKKFGWPTEDVAALDHVERRIAELEEVTRPSELKLAEPKQPARPAKAAAAR
jgi:hypothetical protein